MANLHHHRCGIRTLFLFIISTGSLISESAAVCTPPPPQPPHIVFILADDFGWSDVSFRDPEMYTPNIDEIMRMGVHMTSSYMQQVCTPSRAAFLTGKYPMRLGVQSSVFQSLKNNSLPVDVKVLPEHLKELNYSTQYIGKWHLGFCNPRMTPTGRGFDTYYGMYNGEADYFNHTGNWNGYDMHDDNGTDPQDYRIPEDARGVYSTNLFSDKAVEILEKHDKNIPLFLWLSYQAVHGPIEVPQYYVDKYCPNVTAGLTRKLHCAMAAAMDEGIGNVTSALRNQGYWDNLILIFTSDNGGPVSKGSSNFPLRGAKTTLWEGGTRVVTAMQSKRYLPNAPYEWNGLMHAVDWYPTLMRAAGYQEKIPGIDGMNLWENIMYNAPSNRTEMLYNIDPMKEVAVIRVGRYKLHNGTNNPDDWDYPPVGVANITGSKKKAVMLFDLEDDPSETTPIENQTLIDELLSKLEEYSQEQVPLQYAEKISDGKPFKHNGNWVTGWCELV